MFRAFFCSAFFILFAQNAFADGAMVQVPAPSQERLWELQSLEAAERRKPTGEQDWGDILEAYTTLFQESGHPGAAYQLAHLYLDAGLMAYYLDWISQSAEAGSPRAQLEFGTYMIDRMGNCEQGMALIADAAERWSEAQAVLDARRAEGICAG